MKKLAMAVAFTVITCLSNISMAAADNANQVIIKNGTQNSIKGSETIFNGNARIDMLFTQLDDRAISGAYVTFDPGVRSSWHTHPKGQILVVTAGSGLTQEWGKPIQEINPGDIIWCPPGVKHWHGAKPNTAMTHLSFCEAVDGSNVNWLEKVSDKQYKGEE